MSARVTTLPNGVRIVTHAMPHLETVSLGVWVNVGARHEADSEQGISHLLEHMAFKGTAKRSARDIAEEIEAVGGELNAATSLETTSYFARVLKGDEGVALSILADILRDSAFEAEELEREREVILQEIAAIQDSPDEIAYDLLHDAAFPGQPAGRPIIGTAHSVVAFTPADLRAFLGRHYQARALVVAAAGAVDHDVIVRHAEALFGGLARGEHRAVVAARYSGGVRVSDKPFEQAHLLVGFPSASYRDPDFFAAQVLSGLLGGGMSSRLFQEAREKRGLCYAIYSSAWGLDDAGLLAIHAATGSETMAELIDVVGHELRGLAATGPTDAELQRSKAQLKAGLLMSLESSSARAEQMARQIIVHGRVVDSAELIANVEAVTANGVRTLTERMLTDSPPSVAIVGAGRRGHDHAERARRVVQA